jgi:hypothetical protein
VRARRTDGSSLGVVLFFRADFGRALLQRIVKIGDRARLLVRTHRRRRKIALAAQVRAGATPHPTADRLPAFAMHAEQREDFSRDLDPHLLDRRFVRRSLRTILFRHLVSLLCLRPRAFGSARQ